MKVGIIGVSGYGATYPKTLAAHPTVTIAAICDVNSGAATAFAEKHHIEKVFTDYHDLLKLPELSAVFIATPHFLHHAMVLEALKAGKHVFCEKPLAITSAHAWEMAQAARKAGLVLSCHYNRRQSPEVKALKDLVQRGTLGEVYHVNLKWMARYTEFMFDPNTTWRVSKVKAGGGILIGRGSHMLDAICYILGRPVVKSVYAVVHNRLANLEVDDYALVVLTLEKGASVHLECSYEAHSAAFGEKMEYEVFGTKAGASFLKVDSTAQFKLGSQRFPTSPWVDSSSSIDLASYQEVEPKTILGDFLQAVEAGSDPVVTGEEAAWVTDLVEAAYRSAETHQIVFLKEDQP